jgi:hypothetical protein
LVVAKRSGAKRSGAKAKPQRKSLPLNASHAMSLKVTGVQSGYSELGIRGCKDKVETRWKSEAATKQKTPAERGVAPAHVYMVAGDRTRESAYTCQCDYTGPSRAQPYVHNHSEIWWERVAALKSLSQKNDDQITCRLETCRQSVRFQEMRITWRNEERVHKSGKMLPWEESKRKGTRKETTCHG